MERHSNSERGRPSTDLTTLAAVVVKPATLSNSASRGCSAPVITYGSAPKNAANSQPPDANTKPSRTRTRSWVG